MSSSHNGASYCQGLESAKYFVADAADDMPDPRSPQSDRPASNAPTESTIRRVGPFVCVMFVSALLGVAWQNRESIKLAAEGVSAKASNPFDLVLWLGGSKHSTNGVFEELRKKVHASSDRYDASWAQDRLKKVDLNASWNTRVKSP